MKYIYVCEGNADGIFTGIYEAWASGLGHENIRLETEEESYNQELFCQYQRVEADGEKAAKVARSIEKKIGREAYEIVYRSTLSGREGRADDIYRFLILGFSAGSSALEQLSHAYVRPVFERNRNVSREYQHYQGFLRFSELENGILFSEIRPFNHLLVLLGDHFSDRFPGENWIIFDAGRKKAALHRKDAPFVLMEISGKEEIFQKLGVWKYSQREEELQGLWKEFVDTIGIKERKNEKLQKQMLPLRFREFMREYSSS